MKQDTSPTLHAGAVESRRRWLPLMWTLPLPAMAVAAIGWARQRAAHKEADVLFTAMRRAAGNYALGLQSAHARRVARLAVQVRSSFGRAPHEEPMPDYQFVNRKMSLWLAATVATAAFAQSSPEPAASQTNQPRAAASSPLTRQDLLACVELEDGIETRKAAHETQVAKHSSEGSAVEAEALSIDEAQKLLKSADKAAVGALSRRIEDYNRRVAALNASAAERETHSAQLGADVNRYNAACTGRPYTTRDKQLALADYRDRKAVAAAAGPFEAGVAAFDKGKHQEAFASWLPLAEQGRPSAQFNIAVMYEQGLGVTKSDVEAARWYLAAAERGVGTAQLKSGTLYEAGVGVAKDLSSASFWYGEAAKGSGKDSDTAIQARERLARLPKEYQAGSEDIVNFEGGRFVLRRASNKECVVALQGTVTQSANFKFEDVIKKANAQGCAKPLLLLLESPGGLHDAGLELARSVRAEGMRTVARYECASACSTIFLGGTERVLWGARAAIGFHQLARVRDGGKFEDGICVQSRDDPGIVAMRRFLRFVVPETSDELFRMVMGTPCKSIDWVKGKRAMDLQVATRIEAEGEDIFGPREERVNAAATVPR